MRTELAEPPHPDLLEGLTPSVVELPPDARQYLCSEEPAVVGPVGKGREASESPTFSNNSEGVVRLGPLVASFKRLGLAIRDPRCHRPHLRVLYHLMERLNRTTGTAFPGRKVVAQQEELSEKTVENVLYELRAWGYVDWARRAAPMRHAGRRLLHYTLPVVSWSEEDITAAILAYREERDGQGPRRDGDKNSLSQRAEKLPAPTGSSMKSPPLDGSNSPRPDGVSNLKKEPGVRGAVEPTDEDQAIAIYNRAATTHGFFCCRALTPQRRARLKKRLTDVGGVSAFALALAAIPRHDFLMGRTKPKPGQAQFKLDLDRLLHTDGFMGDVLAKLIDLALTEEAGSPSPSPEEAAREIELRRLSRELAHAREEPS